MTKPSFSRRTKLLAVAAVGSLWLIGSGVALYSLQVADQQLFDPRLLDANDAFEPQRVANDFSTLTQGSASTLLVPWDPDCSCTPAAEEHLLATAPLLRQHNADVVVVTKVEHVERAHAYAAILEKTGLSIKVATDDAHPTLIPSSPAAVLLSNINELVYFGPWSSGGSCVTGIGGFVESALLTLSEDVQPVVVNRAAVGCYCPWRPAVNIATSSAGYQSENNS